VLCGSLRQAHFKEFVEYWPEYSQQKLTMAWKKSKKGKFSLKKEPPKSWLDRQLHERQRRVEMFHEVVRGLAFCLLGRWPGCEQLRCRSLKWFLPARRTPSAPSRRKVGGAEVAASPPKRGASGPRGYAWVPRVYCREVRKDTPGNARAWCRCAGPVGGNAL
jgi:hypothetical protein